MTKNIIRISNFALAMCFLISISSLAVESSRQAYLSAEELLDLYESMYSKIHNVHVIYTNMLEETKGDSPRLKRFTRFDTSEIIEEEGCEKFYRRWSSAPEGFEDPDGTIAEKAFSGSATSEYYPETEFGSISPGRTARAVDELNMLWGYMLLYRPRPYEKPDEPLIRFCFSDKSRVRRQLEQVSGEWCHVVDSFSRDKSKPYATVWIAADKNGLPMKFERYDRGKCIRRILVTKVGSAVTDTGKIWFPEQASKEFNDRYGYTLYRFQVQSLRVNIETTPDMFKVSFPPGTDVIDHVAGIYYTTGPLSEKKPFGVLEGSMKNTEQQALLEKKAAPVEKKAAPVEKKAAPGVLTPPSTTAVNEPTDILDPSKDYATRPKSNLGQVKVNRRLTIVYLLVAGMVVISIIIVFLIYRKYVSQLRKK